MPHYGLTPDQIQARPWRLEPRLLQPSKVITDMIYPSVFLNELERRIIDIAPFQHLRRVKQLGSAQLVYPGTTHNRFAHSLGTLRRAQDLLDAVLSYRSGLNPVPDYFAQLTHNYSEDPAKVISAVAEITVLTRLGALMHDICHISFGHTLEDNLRILIPHDANKERLDAVWEAIPEGLIPGDLAHHIERLVLSKDGLPRPTDDVMFKYPFVDDIVNNNVCADLLDYVVRDHNHAGLPIAIGERFLDSFYVSEQTKVSRPQLVLQAHRGRIFRRDLVDEVIKLLRYRYEETDRILFHHTKLAADAMVGHLVVLMYEVIWRELVYGAVTEISKSLGQYVRHLTMNGANRHDLAALVQEKSHSPNQPPSFVPLGALPRLLPLDDADVETAGTGEPERLSDAWFRKRSWQATRLLEELFARHGDDGLLEQVAFYWTPDQPTFVDNGANRRTGGNSPAGTGELRRYASRVAKSILDRDLYREIGMCTFAHHPKVSPTKIRKDFLNAFGSAQRRMNLEEGASRFIGCSEEWAVLLWVPDVNMQLKLASMPVNTGENVVPLSELTLGTRGGRNPANTIAEDHQELWSLRVFLRRDNSARSEVVLAWLKDELQKRMFSVEWLGGESRPLWDLVLGEIGETEVSYSRVQNLRDKYKKMNQLSARGSGTEDGSPTFDSLVTIARSLLKLESERQSDS